MKMLMSLWPVLGLVWAKNGHWKPSMFRPCKDVKGSDTYHINIHPETYTLRYKLRYPKNGLSKSRIREAHGNDALTKTHPIIPWSAPVRWRPEFWRWHRNSSPAPYSPDPMWPLNPRWTESFFHGAFPTKKTEMIGHYTRSRDVKSLSFLIAMATNWVGR